MRNKKSDKPKTIEQLIAESLRLAEEANRQAEVSRRLAAEIRLENLRKTEEYLKKAAELHKLCDFRDLHGIWLNNPIDCSNELANDLLIERSQGETIGANDLKYSVRFGKRYKYGRCKVQMDRKERTFLSCDIYGDTFRIAMQARSN